MRTGRERGWRVNRMKERRERRTVLWPPAGCAILTRFHTKVVDDEQSFDSVGSELIRMV
jgi:hypothetical protein